MTQLRINMTPAGTGDTTPPSISIIFAQKVGSTGWTLTITTDEGDGALYYLVTQGTATKPQVLAGATQPVTQIGRTNHFRVWPVSVQHVPRLCSASGRGGQ
jgi:hypothetical protein